MNPSGSPEPPSKPSNHQAEAAGKAARPAAALPIIRTHRGNWALMRVSISGEYRLEETASGTRGGRASAQPIPHNPRNKEKIRPQRDGENAFARASGGPDGIRTFGQLIEVQDSAGMKTCRTPRRPSWRPVFMTMSIVARA